MRQQFAWEMLRMKDYKDIEDVPNQIKLYHTKSLGVKVWCLGAFSTHQAVLVMRT
jgi:hypothetical protein